MIREEFSWDRKTGVNDYEESVDMIKKYSMTTRRATLQIVSKVVVVLCWFRRVRHQTGQRFASQAFVDIAQEILTTMRLMIRCSGSTTSYCPRWTTTSLCR